MIYDGCSDWAEWRAASDFDIPEPQRVVFAQVEPASDGSVRLFAAWRDAQGYALIQTWLPQDRDGHEHNPVVRVSDEDMLTHLLSWGDMCGLKAQNRSWPADQAYAEAVALAARLDVEIVWKVTVSRGDWDYFHTHTVAAYRSRDMAMAHVMAEEMQEEARDPLPDESEEYPDVWGLDWAVFRTSLPTHLVPYASGQIVPAPRPSRAPFPETGRKDGDWMVRVPGRGTVLFTGTGARSGSAVFLVTLAKAKPVPHDMSDTECFWQDADPRLTGTAVTWDRPNQFFEGSTVSRADAEGIDATGLAQDVFAAVQGAIINQAQAVEEFENDED